MAKPKQRTAALNIPVMIPIHPDILAMPRGPERKAAFVKFWHGYELRYGLKDDNPEYEVLKIEDGYVYLIKKG